MKIDEQAATMERKDVVELLVSHQRSRLLRRLPPLRARNDELNRQLEWFKRQLFGSKSERRLVDPEGRQLWLGELQAQDSPRPGSKHPGRRASTPS